MCVPVFFVIVLLFSSRTVAARTTEGKTFLSNWPWFLMNDLCALGLSGSSRGNGLSGCFGNPVPWAVSSGSSEFPWISRRLGFKKII